MEGNRRVTEGKGRGGEGKEGGKGRKQGRERERGGERVLAPQTKKSWRRH